MSPSPASHLPAPLLSSALHYTHPPILHLICFPPRLTPSELSLSFFHLSIHLYLIWSHHLSSEFCSISPMSSTYLHPSLFSPLVSTLRMLRVHSPRAHTSLLSHVSGFLSVLLWSRCMPNCRSCSQKARSVFTL